MKVRNVLKVFFVSFLFLFVMAGTSYALDSPTDLKQYSGGTLLPVDSWTSSNQIKLEATKPAGWTIDYGWLIGQMDIATYLQFEVYKDGSLVGTYDSPSSMFSETQSITQSFAEGVYTWRVKAVSTPDLFGSVEVSGWINFPYLYLGTQNPDFKIDTTGPTGSILINNDAQYTNNPSAVTLNLTANDSGIGNTGLQRRVWNIWIPPWIVPSWAAYPANNTIDPWPLLVGADGPRTVYIRYRDSLKNESNTYNDSIIVDTTLPDTTINTGPSGTINTSSAAFNFSGTDPGGSGVTEYLYRLDGGSWISTTSTSVTLNNLSAGSHTFEVKAKDAAGNEDSTPASRTFTYALPGSQLAILSTSLSLSAKPKAIKAGKATLIKGQLKDASGKPVAGKKVKIKANGKTIKTLTTNAAGRFSFKHKPKKTTRYQASYAGDSSYKASKAKVVKVTVKKAKKKKQKRR